MNRQKLKAQLIKERDSCDWCDGLITDNCDMHEWLIKRSAVPKRKQNKIFDPRNCALLHHSPCHMMHGQTTAMRDVLMPIFIHRYGKDAMLDFIYSLELKSDMEYIMQIESCTNGKVMYDMRTI
tara:strand:+ start:282 stop:653 length:372 start_codon:yes stop_codon:yes gene_type:complete